MIISEDLVFIHMEKTGGQFVTPILTRLYRTITTSSTVHDPVSDITQEYQHLPRIGFIREPQDWYVSWFNFFHYKMVHFPQMHVGTKYRKYDLLLELGMDDPQADINDVLGKLIGYYTSELHYFYDDSMMLGRTENLREDLITLLDQITGINPVMKKVIRKSPKVNVSPIRNKQILQPYIIRQIENEKKNLDFSKFNLIS